MAATQQPAVISAIKLIASLDRHDRSMIVPNRVVAGDKMGTALAI